MRNQSLNHEVLRVAAELHTVNNRDAILNTCKQILLWANQRSANPLPKCAWNMENFEELSAGRTCIAIRTSYQDNDVWMLKLDDPDKNVPGRTWSVEAGIVKPLDGSTPKITLRLYVGTPEADLRIEPSVPGVIRQLISDPLLHSGKYQLFDHPTRVSNEEDAEILCNILTDTTRKFPIIALSVPESQGEVGDALLDANFLAQKCAGIAAIVVLPPAACWAITEKFGKQLSVFNGAARVYLPGFSEDANPFGVHQLILARDFNLPDKVIYAQNRLRWIAARTSVQNLNLGTDLFAFSALKTHELEIRQKDIKGTRKTDQELIKNLEERLTESEKYQQSFSDDHKVAEERAEAAEAQRRSCEFRIQQLLERLKQSGISPDDREDIPRSWSNFANWCDINLAGRVILTPQARRVLKGSSFTDVECVAKCLLWLANEFRDYKLNGSGEGSLRDISILNGIVNAHCGSDQFTIEWQGKCRDVTWHIKNNGNTRDPSRCLRIYYFWDEQSGLVVIAQLPAHRVTGAS